VKVSVGVFVRVEVGVKVLVALPAVEVAV